MLRTLVPALFIIAATAHPDSIQEVRELAQGSNVNLEAEASERQERKERCTSCSGNGNVPDFNTNHVFEAIRNIPATEFHSSSSFEGCSTEKGCAGIKIKDGQVVQKYGDVEAFKSAAASDKSKDVAFLPNFKGFGNEVFENGFGSGGPFWWMQENSPFKQAYTNFKAEGSTGQAGSAGFSSSLDLSKNPFFNGDLMKQLASFASSQANSFGSELAGNPFLDGKVKPAIQSSSSYQSSSFGTSGNVDLAKNPFFNGDLNKISTSGSFQANQFGSGGQFGGCSSGGCSTPTIQVFQGSSPSPFTASPNLIQQTQKEYQFEQQQQQRVDGFPGGHSTGDLQQTCAGQGYVCVHKAQCNNGVVNTNGVNILQARTKKQYCNTRTEICCRIEIAPIPGAVGSQGTLGVGGATFEGSESGSSIFSSSSAANGGSGGAAFDASAAGGSNAFDGSASFGGSSNSFEGSSSFSGNNNRFDTSSNTGFGATASGTTVNKFGSESDSSFNSQGTTASGSAGQGGQSAFGATGGSNGFSGSESSFTSSSSSFASNGFNSNGFNQVGNGNTQNGFDKQDGYNGFTSSTSFKETVNSNKFGQNGGGGIIKVPAATGGQDIFFKETANTQTNFIDSESDSFSSSSANSGVYRPGQSSNKPGIPYLPPAPVDNSFAGSVVSSTARPTTVYIPAPPVTTPRPPPPRPTTPRPAPRPTAPPTYLPPSTAAPSYLPPPQEELESGSNQNPVLVPGPRVPEDTEGSLILDVNRQPQPKQTLPNEIPAGCAAALKCTPIEYCTAEGVMSDTPVALTRDQEAFRVPLTDCREISTGRVGKCCRDPNYTDPWPVNQLGKWVPGVFGGNDGAYVPDNKGSPNNPRPAVDRPGQAPISGGLILNNYRTTPRPAKSTPGPNQIVPDFSVTPIQPIQGINQQSQGQTVNQGFGQTQGFGQRVSQGKGQIVTQGFGQTGQAVNQGLGQSGFQAQGQFGQASQGGQGQFSQGGQGQIVAQGQGQFVSQGQGQFVSQGQGQFVSQGQGQIENVASESTQRVFLSQFNAGGQCGLLNGEKPYGNRNELEVDFAEIPWQAMVLLKTNKSLLCGGVITRPEVVLTTASCVEGLLARDVLIKGGEWKLGIDDEPLPFQIVQVKHILRHPKYVSGRFINDVAILVLTENLRFAKNIYPICLPGAQDTLDGFYNGAGECIVTGWGKVVLQAHLQGAIMHSLNVSLINPGECQAKLSQDYPHLLEQYDADSCACGLPTNPLNNICKVDTGSALACTTGNGHFELRGIYSWDSGCQLGNQLAAFYKFDLGWYEWALGLSSGSSRLTQQFGGAAQQNGFQANQGYQIKGGFSQSGIKGFAQGSQVQSGIKGGYTGQAAQLQSGNGFIQSGQGFSSQQNQFLTGQSGLQGGDLGKFAIQGGPAGSNAFSASYSSSQKEFFQSKPQIITYTTKPEIVTYTTKPEIVTFTTKPEYFTYTTKPQVIRYETSGSLQNPQYVAPGVTFNPSFGDIVGKQHVHNAQCRCLENGKK